MNQPATKDNAFLFYACLIVFLIVLSIYVHLIDRSRAVGMLQEDGVVEILSALGYFLCLGVMVFVGRLNYLRRHFPLAVFVVLCGLRELDFDKRFTSTGLLQSRIITSADVALLERMLGLLVIVGLIVLVVYSLRQYGRAFVRRLMAFDSVAIGVAIALGLMFVSKSIDGLGRKLEPFGIIVSEPVAFSAGAVEEVLELGIPIVLIVATLAYLRQQRR